jgi:hypothetical protein
VDGGYNFLILEIKYIKHNTISTELLEVIASIKKNHWNYSIKEHLNWMNKNLNFNDIHVLMNDDKNSLVAYLNLVKISITINTIETDFFGIGNVCVNIKNKGYGSLLLKHLNQFIKENNFKGVLLCKDSLVHFYELNSWELVEKSKTSNNLKFINVCIFNVDVEIENLTYIGKLF